MTQAFTKESMELLMQECVGHDMFHMDPGHGIILRHDIDGNMEKSYRLSKMQDEIGVKATYFVLDTKPYFKRPETFEMLRDMQANGHEIGWHNDALLVWGETYCDLRAEIERPLRKLRSEGLKIIGTTAHGNRIAKGFVNHQIWAGANENELYDTVPWTKYITEPIPGIGNPQFYLNDFGLLYDGVVSIHRDLYLNDNRAAWFGDIRPAIRDAMKNKMRVILSLHPQHWDI